MQIDIQSNSLPFVNYLKNDVPEGVSVHLPSVVERRTLDAGAVYTAIITITPEITTELIKLMVEWIYNHFPEKPNTYVCIERQEVSRDKGEITKVVTEKITIKKS